MCQKYMFWGTKFTIFEDKKTNGRNDLAAKGENLEQKWAKNIEKEYQKLRPQC